MSFSFYICVFMSTLGSDVVVCARGWIGTRFQHQGRLKRGAAHRGGVDCLGLLVGVAAELGLRDCDGLAFVEADERDYSHMPDVGRLKTRLLRVMREVEESEMRVGDVLLMDVDGRAQHLGIVTDEGLIHAYAPARAVVEHALDAWWRARIVAVFRVF